MGKGEPWSPAEDALVISNADKTASWEGWTEILPNRTRDAINIRRSHLGVAPPKHYSAWTDEHRRELVRGMRELCERVGHDPYQCSAELHRIMKNAKRRKDARRKDA